MSDDPQEAQFALASDECLEQVASWLEAFDPDEVDYTMGDGVLKIEFPDGLTFVLNRQSAAQQMWFAAGTHAWHFDRLETGTWSSTKDGTDLLHNIAQAVGAKLGRPVAF